MPAPKGGSDEPVSINRNVGDSGFSLRQRPRRFHSQQVSPLSSLRSAALDCGRLRVERDIALSPTPRGYRLSILNGDTGRPATKSRLPPPGLVAQRALELHRSGRIFAKKKEALRIEVMCTNS